MSDRRICNLAIYAYKKVPLHYSEEELLAWAKEEEVDIEKLTDYMGALPDWGMRSEAMRRRMFTQGVGEAVRRYFIEKEAL